MRNDIFILGIFSGIPYGALYTMFSAMLKDLDASLEMLGILALARAPYSLRYLWAPFVDTSPKIFKIFECKRKYWMLVSILLQAFFIFFMSKTQIYFIPIILYGISASIYDISYDAYRIEREEKEEFAISYSILGYRIGLVISGAIGLYIAEKYSWKTALNYLITITLLSIPFIVLSKRVYSMKLKDTFSFKRIIKSSVLSQNHIKINLMIILLYKLGEAMLLTMTYPFLSSLGYSKTDIAFSQNFVGIFASIAGTYIGSFLINKQKSNSLFICGIIQMLSHLIFCLVSELGEVSYLNLFAIVITENIACGMATSALIFYITGICSRKYIATEYAFLSSISTVANNIFASTSGFFASILGWSNFFLFTMLLCLPSLLLIIILEVIKKGAIESNKN